MRLLVAVLVLMAGLGVAACGRSPAGPLADLGAHGVLDPDAMGPAADVPGARKGGTITVYAETAPETDPTDAYSIDAQEIAKLLFRTPTQFTMRAGRPVLVPDLTDLGTVSPDQLTWTFTMRAGIRYEDGSAVTVADLAYAIERSFAHDVYSNGPTYQMAYLADGDTYQGPYKDGTRFTGVSTPDSRTLVIHLRKPFPDLPLFLSFPMFTPIPAARDTREAYRNHPLATGPYAFDTFTPGVELTLRRNENWDAATDPARHQYPDRWDFRWGGDRVRSQQLVLDSRGEAANALDSESLDASLVPQLTGHKAAQLIEGDSPCTTVLNLDSRKLPLDVRRAVATAYPADQLFAAEGENDYVAARASTIMPPSVAGYTRYAPLPDLTGTGHGDPAAARAMLAAAGKLGFTLRWYYDDAGPTTREANRILADALSAAGFTVEPIGVDTAEYRARTNDYTAPVNLGQGPSTWCSDWPTGSSWFPVLFQSHSIADGTSWGMLADTALDAEIGAVGALPADQRATRWMQLDEKVMSRYVVIPRYSNRLAVVVGTNVGGGEDDSTLAMPLLPNLFLRS